MSEENCGVCHNIVAVMKQALRSQCQYLDLAIAMRDTRRDYSKGNYRVIEALARFVVSTEQDQKIYDEVSSCIYIADGRVFRNIDEWNYDAIFAIADKKLKACYDALFEIEVNLE